MKAIPVAIGSLVVGAVIGSAVGYVSVTPPTPVVLDSGGAIAGPGIDTSAPKIVVDQPTFEFGTMQRGSKMRHNFVIRNDGSAALKLIAGRPSCKCTAFEVTSESIPAGGEAEIGLEWVAKSVPGPFRQTAPVNTNDPTRPVVELAIEGTVIEPSGLEPSAFEFGEIRSGEPASASIIYFTTKEGEIDLTAEAPSREEVAGLYEVKIEPVDKSELPTPNAVAGRRVTLTSAAGLPVGPMMEWVKLNAGQGDDKELEVPVAGRVVGDITVHGGKWHESAGVLNLGMVPSDEGAKSRLLLSVKGEHAADTRFEIISVDPPELQVELGETKRRSDDVYHTNFTVEVPEGTRPMIHLNTAQGDDGVIRIKTTHPKSPEVVVRVRFAVTK